MLNNTVLTGRLTKIPEIKQVGENLKPVVNFTLAVERDFADDSNERKADFIPVVAWNGLAKFIAGNFGKGGALSVQGRLQSRNWDDADGKKHYVIELVADNAYFAGESKKSNEMVAENDEDYR
ncbi:MAG: single-stranded DNA-binding protein [Ruminiclostridium sp.]|nr:single-stranded DNA-binding protein [Ruminiclostridium sp.]